MCNQAVMDSSRVRLGRRTAGGRHACSGRTISIYHVHVSRHPKVSASSFDNRCNMEPANFRP
jgi:hypothetical protein